MTSPSPFDCFGVPIEGPSTEDVIQRVRNGSVHWVVTANPEILLEAHRNEDYRDALRQADLRTADGVGLTLMARVFGKHLFRVPGVTLAEHVLREASGRHWRVAFVGGSRGIAAQALAACQKRYPGLMGDAWNGGVILPDGRGDGTDDETVQQLIQTAPDVLFVAFGHPKQERWIAKHFPDFPRARLIMGIGGAFDFWVGTVRRAPVWMQNSGLEWTYRLAREPARFMRIIRAVIQFPVALLRSKLFMQK